MSMKRTTALSAILLSLQISANSAFGCAKGTSSGGANVNTNADLVETPLVGTYRHGAARRPGTVIKSVFERRVLNMTICTDKCFGDCKTYITPLDECYSSYELFPNDPSWSGLDILDTIEYTYNPPFKKEERGIRHDQKGAISTGLTSQMLLRTIYETNNQTCHPIESQDTFQIPLDTCVGPFGPPRPWGTFEVLQVSGSTT